MNNSPPSSKKHEELVTPLLTPPTVLSDYYQEIINRENRRSWCRKHLHSAWARLTGANDVSKQTIRKKMYVIAKLRMGPKQEIQ